MWRYILRPRKYSGFPVTNFKSFELLQHIYHIYVLVKIFDREIFLVLLEYVTAAKFLAACNYLASNKRNACREELLNPHRFTYILSVLAYLSNNLSLKMQKNLISIKGYWGIPL